jgi:hypothetical protein
MSISVQCECGKKLRLPTQAVSCWPWISVYDLASRAHLRDRGIAFSADRRHVAIGSTGTIWIVRLAPPPATDK